MVVLGEVDAAQGTGRRLKGAGPRVLGFLVRAALLYLVLLWPWLGLERGYEVVYREALHHVVKILPLDTSISLWECTAPDPRISTCVQYTDSASGEVRKNAHRGGRMAFLSTVFLAALILATPIRRPYRLQALLLGQGVFAVYVALRVATHLYGQFTSNPLAWLPLALSDRKLLVFAVSHPPWYIAPVVVWVVTVAHRVHAELIAPAPERQS